MHRLSNHIELDCLRSRYRSRVGQPELGSDMYVPVGVNRLREPEVGILKRLRQSMTISLGLVIAVQATKKPIFHPKSKRGLIPILR